MKKLLILLFGLIVFTQGVSYAYDCSNLQYKMEQGTINAKGEAQKKVLPDTVVLNFEVSTKDKKPQEALSLNKKRAQDVIDTLSAYLDTTKGDFIQTSNFSLNPRYIYLEKQQKLDGYVATHTITVESHKTSDAGKFIDLAVKAGVNRVSSISFKLKNKDAICQELLKESSKKARFEADMIASAMGVKIGKIKRINYYCSDDSIRPYPLHRAMLSDSMESAKITPIMPQNLDVKVTINVEFYLED